MFGLEQPSHWLIIIIAAAVIFGYKKLPEMSRSLGRSLRIFKSEMKGLSDDDAARAKADKSKDTDHGNTTASGGEVPADTSNTAADPASESNNTNDKTA